MSFRELLAKLNDIFRPPHVQGEDPLADDKIDALAPMAGSEIADLGFGVGTAPTNWVPSQQDDRPRH
ncbi:MAG TPA: hypothetical protein VJ838_16425 [Gaiellaceae bacterium]|nr:hypothetical protein [Gaiellaceae bacterium]